MAKSTFGGEKKLLADVKSGIVKRWRVAPSPDGKAVKALAEALDLTRLAAALLVQRLPNPSPEAARAFLRPSLAELSSPWSMAGMAEAAARLSEAIKRRERIWIHGDYDADGVTATALLVRLLRALGCEPVWYLPCRFGDGYGVADEFIRRVQQQKPSAVVTVDCGIAEPDKIRAISAAGCDTIVVDHHEPPAGGLPPALAVLHTQQPGLPHSASGLAAVGVAFKLAWAICEKIAGKPKVGDELQRLLISLLPLVAVGSVADVAPLRDENRILVAHGLSVLRQGPPGLYALWQASGLDPARAEAHEVAFMVAPRLNAAGRMRHASLALELLLAEDATTAAPLATELSRLNSERQTYCEKVAAAALAAAVCQCDPADSGAIVVAGDGWHEGVIGIVASRLAETFGRPAAVIAFPPGEETGKGSARSISGIHLYEALAHCAAQGCLVAFGGHEQAAGFKIQRDRLPIFQHLLDAWCRQRIAAGDLAPEMAIDLEVRIPEIGEAVGRDIQRLAPFGCGNPIPRFLARGVRIAGEPQTFGRQDEHFRFYASQDGAAVVAKAFDSQRWLHEIDNGRREWDMVFHIVRNQGFFTNAVELHIKDMRPAESCL